MSFLCHTCFKPYTGPGTDHALYTTTCGHLIGRSCLMDIMNTPTVKKNQLCCHECCKNLKQTDYHPVYNVPDEVFNLTFDGLKMARDLNDDYVKEQYLMGSFQQETLFLKKWNCFFKGPIEIYDYFNGYLLIVGNSAPLLKDNQVLSIIDTKDGKYCYSLTIVNNLCTTVAINKYRDDVFEFAIGYADGSLKIMVGCLEGSDFNPNCNDNYMEDAKIDSICYMEKNKIAYSAGKGNLIVVCTNKKSRKYNWAKDERYKRNYITDLQKLTDDTLLGLVNGKIYLFYKNQQSYEISKTNESKVINYTVDPGTKMLIMLCCKTIKTRRTNRMSYSYILCEINEKVYSENDEEENQMYHTTIIKTIHCSRNQFKPPLIPMKEGRKSALYSLLPDVKNKALGIHHITCEENTVGQELFECLSDCIGIVCLNESHLLLPKISKVKIIVLFIHKFDIVDFYSIISD